MSHGGCPQSTDPDESQDNLHTAGQRPEKSSNFSRLVEGPDEGLVLNLTLHEPWGMSPVY